MRSRPFEALLLALALAAPAAAAEPPLTRERVDAEARTLAQLPGLTGSKVERRLEMRLDEEARTRERREPPSWLRWVGDFFEWLNDTSRWLVWLLIAAAVALVALRLRRWLRDGGAGAGRETLSLPTHVRELDIRPETLPPDIGAAALALWQQGQPMAAMSLLYRGALSQLVHRHAVPIRASSTEGDCLALAAPRVDADAHGYLRALVGAWRQTVYAGRPPADDDARALCQAFGQRFPPERAA